MAKKSAGKRPAGPRRHVPQRTCVACRDTTAKRALVRIVRTPAGAVVVDPTGKLAGRGAYLCQDPACWELAFKRRALEHALQVSLSEHDRAGLVAYQQQLATAEAAPPPPAAVSLREFLATMDDEA